ncbi:MAG: DNA polymerase III subunit beta [Defluviitaleaceae bacterium]|nr:DNA polymerase III subunit beta [Defluviitaleaceae bacterium]
MHIVCSKDKLIQATNIAIKAVSVRTTLEILECFLIEAEDKLKIYSNDLEMTIETSEIEVTIIEKGKIAINAKMFFDIIRKLPENDIIIKVEENYNVYIKSGKVEFKIMGQNPLDFPEIVKLDKIEKYSVSSKIFKNMIRQTIFSISTTDDKPALTGFLLEIENGFLNLVTVDNFRISLRSEELVEINKDISVLVPSKTLNELSKLLNSDDNLDIYFSDKYILFELQEAIIISKLKEGEFIRYKQILEQNHTIKFLINKKEILESLERSLIVSNDTKKNPVSLKINDRKLTITSTAEIGNLYDEISIDNNGPSLEISFNPKYLIEAIKSIDKEEIYMNFSASLSPCIITSDEEINYKYLVLPLRLN